MLNERETSPGERAEQSVFKCACRAAIRLYTQGTVPIRISEHHYVPVAYSIAVRPI